jgi:hypothetical protein
MNASLNNIIFQPTNSTNCIIQIRITRNRSIYQRICRCLFLFLFGTITLKRIFYHFQNYNFKRYKCINQHFEKPASVLFQEYRIAPLFLHLKQWRITNEAESLMVVQYAMKPRNPE